MRTQGKKGKEKGKEGEGAGERVEGGGEKKGRDRGCDEERARKSRVKG